MPMRISSPHSREAQLMPDRPSAKRESHIRKKQRPSSSAGAVFAVLSLLMLCWMAFALHPDSRTSADWSEAKENTSLVAGLDVFTVNGKSSAFSSVTNRAEEHYIIPEGALTAPVPDVLSYGETFRARDVMEIIEDARHSGLLGKTERTVFSLSSAMDQDSPILTYLDETILALTWQEEVDGHLCTFCEVKLADASQLRRKLSQDIYAAPVKSLATDLAAQGNAVAAVNADNYLGHELGIAVYQREVRRFIQWPYSLSNRCFNAVDTLFVDASGNFRFSLAGTQWTKEDVERFVSENEIRFSLVCGPVLVIAGQAQPVKSYPLGSPRASSARAAIAQCGTLHYLYVSVPKTQGSSGCTAEELAAILCSKKVEHAYALAGGLTAELVFDNQVYAPSGDTAEVPVSDILYFATALPYKGVAKK